MSNKKRKKLDGVAVGLGFTRFHSLGSDISIFFYLPLKTQIKLQQLKDEKMQISMI